MTVYPHTDKIYSSDKGIVSLSTTLAKARRAPSPGSGEGRFNAIALDRGEAKNNRMTTTPD